MGPQRSARRGGPVALFDTPTGSYFKGALRHLTLGVGGGTLYKG